MKYQKYLKKVRREFEIKRQEKETTVKFCQSFTIGFAFRSWEKRHQSNFYRTTFRRRKIKAGITPGQIESGRVY